MNFPVRTDHIRSLPQSIHSPGGPTLAGGPEYVVVLLLSAGTATAVGSFLFFFGFTGFAFDTLPVAEPALSLLDTRGVAEFSMLLFPFLFLFNFFMPRATFPPRRVARDRGNRGWSRGHRLTPPTGVRSFRRSDV